ncbi:MAG: hypothetical protein IMY71_15055, partial [Bacteroidetes bacterium]|nr:hypothetical protein [Bacteroidota bacterium]
EFFAEYWLPDYPYHIIKRGKVKIKVTGKDTTPPKVRWVQISGDNVIQARIYDGSKIQSVIAKLLFIDNPEEFFEVELKDNGKEGDRAEADNVFSKKIPDRKFGLYNIEIKAADSFGNNMVEKKSDVFILH